MTREEFEEKTFEEVIEWLYENNDEVTTYDMLKDYAKHNIDSENIGIAKHIIDAIWEDENPDNSDWYIYDYTMGILQTPYSVSTKEDVEHLIDFEEE